MWMMDNLRLELLPEIFAVARLEPDAPLPDWVEKCDFVSITNTQEELSIVCQEAAIPDNVIAQRGFCCLKVLGPLDFSLTGILASLLHPLAKVGISIFAISTYDTDYLLLPQKNLAEAIETLTHAGHIVLR